MSLRLEPFFTHFFKQNHTGKFGKRFRFFEEIGSTNDELRHLANQGGEEGTVYLTDFQSAGRGRHQRTWLAPAKSSLLFSTLFRPTIEPRLIHQLVMVCGLSIAEASEALGDVQVGVKWPNDLQIQGKKFAGILPESAMTSTQIDWVIIGTGININVEFLPDSELYHSATSLYIELGEMIDREALLGHILEKYAGWYQQVGQPSLIDAWRSRCITLGKRAEIQAGHRIYQGKAEDIDETGALILKEQSGNHHHINFGEATILSTH